MENKETEQIYRTGSTPVAHKHNMLLLGAAGLLFVSVVVVLSSLISLQMFSPKQNKPLLSLSGGTNQATGDGIYMDGDVLSFPELGITGQPISPFCQEYYSLPGGLYVISVRKNSLAAQYGVLPGDVLLEIPSSQLSIQDILPALLQVCKDGDPIRLAFSRRGSAYYLYLNPEDLE